MSATAGPSHPNRRPDGAPQGSLGSRVSFAAVIVAAFAGLAWADGVGLFGAAPSWWLLPVAAAVAVGSVEELAELFARRGIRMPTGILRPAVTAAALSAALGTQAFVAAHGSAAPAAAMGWPAVVTAVALFAVCGAEVIGYGRRDGALERLAASGFTLALVGLPLACMVSLRLLCVENLGPEQRTAGHLGLVPLVSLIACVKAGDISAYVVGSLVGRHRMAPTLSPGKTWEGAAASLVGSVAAAWLTLAWWRPEGIGGPWGGWPLYGGLVGLAGMVGDLAESLLKRECGVKDSGRALGGLGGFLDLVDSLLCAAPVAWILWVAGSA
ncbi:MAG: phosphatidate cytidylyltransferase [Planctomycetia bacterium]